MVAVSGLPPFGLFSSEFLIVLATIRQVPWLAIPLGLGLVVSAWALMRRLITLCLGAPTSSPGPAPEVLDLLPAWLHLALVLVLGLAMPGFVLSWFRALAGGL